jgi:hypothetical protein
VSAVAARPDSLDAAVAAALADPDLEERVARDPGYAEELVARAGALAANAFTGGDRARLDEAHRTLYLLYAQDAWSPVGAPRQNQHDPTMAAVLRALERGFEASLARHRLPEAPPEDPEAFCAWLSDLALERELVPPTGMGDLLREAATLEQMREIVAQRSLFFLKEPDPWAMVVPSLRGEAKAGLLDLLMDEYGWGRYEHMHSTVYETLMRRLGLDTGFDAYLDRAAPEFLAVLNYQAMLARHRRLCRRMYGYIYLVEADSPRSMENYLAAYRRLGVEDEDVLRFYELHVTADEGHQDVALREVILPVVREQPDAREDIARGVLEGVHLHAGFSAHLASAFRAGRSSLRGAGALA